MKNAKLISTVLGLAVLVPHIGLAAVSLDKPSREKNSFGFKPIDEEDDMTLLINQQDCRDNIKINIRIEDTGGGDGDLYLVVGDGCKDDRDKGSDDCLFREATAGGDGKEWRIKTLLKRISGIDSCTAEGSVKVWAAVLEDPDDRENQSELWSSPITIDYDMDPPDTATGISAGAGEDKVKVSWYTGDDDDDDDEEEEEEETDNDSLLVVRSSTTKEALDDDVDSVLVLYEKVSTSKEEKDTDTLVTKDSESETNTSTPDAGVEPNSSDSDDTDTGSIGASLSVVERKLAATAGDNCETRDGFKKGAEFDPDIDHDEKDTPSSGSLEVDGLTNGTMYRFAVVALDEHKNPSVLSEVVCATPGESVGFLEEYVKAGGKSGEFCFVATAAFGAYDHPVVKVLRAFRDRFLAEVPGGPALIAAYYDVGPDLAAIVEDRPVLKAVSKGALTLVAGLSIPFSVFGPWGMLIASVALMMLGIFISRRRRK